MMNKQFVLSHNSKFDYLPGGLLYYFDEKKHVGIYEKQNFKNVTEKWLKDEKARITASEKSYKIVKENHTWDHRVIQILKDLKKTS